MFSGHETITVEELRHEIAAWNSSGSDDTLGLIGAIMILCNRMADMQHRLEYRHFDDGEALRIALPDLEFGTRIIYHGALHVVIDAGKQGHRIKAVHVPGLYIEASPEIG